LVLGVSLAAFIASFMLFLTLYFLTLDKVLDEFKARGQSAADGIELFFEGHRIQWEALNPADGVTVPEEDAAAARTKVQADFDVLSEIMDLRSLHVFVSDGDGYRSLLHESDALSAAERENARLVYERKATVSSGTVVKTDGEYVYWVYVPLIDDGGAVFGVVEVTFFAANLRAVYSQTAIFGTISVLLMILLMGAVSYLVYVKASEPFFKRMAYTDFLTALGNRMAYEEDKKGLMENPLTPAQFLVAVFDLNNLKTVNDTKGHHAGDRYIKLFAQLMRDNFNSEGGVYRTGGDEFAVIFSHADFDRANFLVKKLQADLLAVEKFFTFACGIALYSRHTDANINAAVQRADDMMYANKKDMKEKMAFDTDLSARLKNLETKTVQILEERWGIKLDREKVFSVLKESRGHMNEHDLVRRAAAEGQTVPEIQPPPRPTTPQTAEAKLREAEAILAKARARLAEKQQANHTPQPNGDGDKPKG
jgi:diguanylate cyclase (GGDEF)-like protein